MGRRINLSVVWYVCVMASAVFVALEIRAAMRHALARS
jgi:hypothetical protein